MLRVAALSITGASGCSTDSQEDVTENTSSSQTTAQTTTTTPRQRETTAQTTTTPRQRGVLYAQVVSSAPNGVDPPTYPADVPRNQHVTEAVDRVIDEASDSDGDREVVVTFPMADMDSVRETYDRLPGSRDDDGPGHYLRYEGEVVRLRLAIQQ